MKKLIFLKVMTNLKLQLQEFNLKALISCFHIAICYCICVCANMSLGIMGIIFLYKPDN